MVGYVGIEVGCCCNLLARLCRNQEGGMEHLLAESTCVLLDFIGVFFRLSGLCGNMYVS